MVEVDAVGRRNKEQVPDRQDRAVADIVLRDVELFHHVVDPHDVGFLFYIERQRRHRFSGGRLGLVDRFDLGAGYFFLIDEGSVVLVVVEALNVEAANFASVSDEP